MGQRGLVTTLAVAAAISAALTYGSQGTGLSLDPSGGDAHAESTAQQDPTGQAAQELDRLKVKGPAPMTGYDRDEFGDDWSDDVTVRHGHDGCDTRNNLLQEQLDDVTLKPGTNDCVVTAGTLTTDPYSGKTIHYDGGGEEIQMDHVVALGDAWKTGAQQLDTDTRRDLANDPLNLLAADASLNQSKGDANIAAWQPPNKAFRCDYAARQIAVKSKYDLWVAPPEKKTLTTVLSSCPDQQLPTEPTS